MSPRSLTIQQAKAECSRAGISYLTLGDDLQADLVRFRVRRRLRSEFPSMTAEQREELIGELLT